LKCDVTDGEDHDASGNVRKAPLFYTGRINAPHRVADRAHAVPDVRQNAIED